MTRDASSERLGIAGSGAIACGLAKAAGGRIPALPTLLWARSDESAARAAEQLGSRGEVTTDLDDLARCTVVVEAIAEDQAAKADLLAKIDALLPPEALLASTTSSLSVAELATASGRDRKSTL